MQLNLTGCVCVCSYQRLHIAQLFDLIPAQVEVGQVGTFVRQSLQRTGQVVVAQLKLKNTENILTGANVLTLTYKPEQSGP